MPKKSELPFTATLRFHDELNDFLPKAHREVDFTYDFNGKPSIKDAIEANQVPHTEIGCILVNGIPVDFSYHLLHLDRASIHPVQSPVARSSPLLLRPAPLPQFIADVHLGKLARYLRLLGFDVVFDQRLDDTGIIRRAVKEQRIILTRDRKLLHAKVITHGCCLHSQTPLTQLREVIDRYDLQPTLRPFSRCLICNGKLLEVAKASIIDRLEPKTRIYYDRFRKCDGCGKVYWPGSHFERLKVVLTTAGLTDAHFLEDRHSADDRGPFSFPPTDSG